MAERRKHRSKTIRSPRASLLSPSSRRDLVAGVVAELETHYMNATREREDEAGLAAPSGKTEATAEPSAVAGWVAAAQQFGLHVFTLLLPSLVAWAVATLLLLIALQLQVGWLLPIVFLAMLVVFLAAEAVILQLAIDLWQGREVTFTSALQRLGTRTLWRFIATSLLTRILTLVGLLCFLVPGLLFLARRGFLSGVVVLLEGSSGVAALRRSGQLTQGMRPWRFVLGSWAAYIAAYAQLSVLLPLGVVSGLPDEIASHWDVIDRTIEGMIYCLWVPFDALLAVWFYLRCAGQSPAAVVVPSARKAVWVPALLSGIFLLQFPFYSRSWCDAFWIPGGSMHPTLQIGDHLFVDKSAYGLELPLFGKLTPTANPRRGDIVAFVSPHDGMTLMKRVVAIEGDEVEIVDKELYVNGELVHEPYVIHADASPSRIPTRDEFGPVVVPDGHFFALGDNRDQSHDSRFWGFARVDDLLGRSIDFVYWSRSTDRWLPNWYRFGPVFDDYATSRVPRLGS